MSWRLKAIAVCALGLPNCAYVQARDNRTIDSTSINVREIIRSRNIEALYDLTHEPVSFDSRGKLHDTVNEFFFQRQRSLLRIMDDPNLRAIELDMGLFSGMEVTWVVYIPGKHWLSYQQDPDAFLRNHYMEKYAVCAFIRTPTGWRFLESLCFAEADDPFSPPPEVG